MGEELCKGCRDCTNPNGTESDFSKAGNIPIAHLTDPFFLGNNPNISRNDNNSFMNNLSFMGNNNNNNNKNDIGAISTQNSKFPYNDGGASSLNLGGGDELYGTRNSNGNGSPKLFASKPLYNNNDNTSLSNNIEKIADNNDIDKNKLEEIIKKYKIALIIKAFRKVKELKNKVHNKIEKEYSFLSGSDYDKKKEEEDLDVDLIPDKTYLYIGNKFNEKKDGQGLEIFSDSNARYFGIYRNGKRVDLGRFVIKNDNNCYIYNGEIKGVYAEGFGKLYDKKNQLKYTGMWKHSRREGYGVEHYKDNSSYKGMFKNGKKHGIGHFKWKDNSYYKGDWKNNMLEGIGIYKFNDGSIYQGEWKENRMNGFGEFTFPDVKTYLGFFQKDTRTGFGILIWYKENKAFIGFWNNNKQNGYGKFIADGKIRYGIWEEGKLIEKIKSKDIFISKLNYDQRNYLPYFHIDDYKQILKCIKKILN